mgnify:CR=1 FL=1
MNDDTLPRCIYIIILVLLGGFFAGSETAFSNCNRVRIKSRADDGDATAKRIDKILNQFDKALVTLLIGNNVIHVLATSTATVLAIQWFGSYGSLISTVVMTLAIFIFSETIPKNVAKANSEAFAGAVSGILYLMMVVLTPVAFCFTLLSNGLKKIFSSKKNEPSITEDDFKSMIETAEDEGVITGSESELIQSALEFSDITVHDVLTPRIHITGIDLRDEPEVCQERIRQASFSRLPVYDRDMDHIVGVLSTKTYMLKLLQTGTCRVEDVMNEPYTVSLDANIHTLFEEMRKRKQHMAIVLDEWGGTLGLVTMEDILESLVGDMWDEDKIEDKKDQKGQAEEDALPGEEMKSEEVAKA